MKRLLLALLVAAAVTAPALAQANSFIKNGATLYWKASTGDNGTMKVANASGQYFEVEQANERNKSAGIQRLYGAILDNGKRVVLLNVGNWKEVWEGKSSADGVSGTIIAGSSNYSFTISVAPPVAQVSTAPFLLGKTLRWKTNASAGQNGVIRVTGVNGSTFTLEQRNDQNPAAGVTKLDGEIKDGKFYIYNRQWKETWVGTLSGGVVSGKINGTYTFQISE